jgi:16S rRNA (cytosine967-C5)-methyltransferase
VREQNPRAIAVELLEPHPGGEFIEHRLESALAPTHISTADRHLCQELVYGIVRWQATLDWLIARKSQSTPEPARLRNLLRLGLYQIFWLDRIPNHAAVHETVELAKRSGLGGKAGFINAVLRGYLREFELSRQLLADLKLQQPALGFSHPQWLAARWEEHWGSSQTAQLMAWNNTPPKTFGRVNRLKATPGALLSQWRNEGVEYDLFRRDWLDEDSIFELKSHPALGRLPSFQQGLFYVQDPSTLLAVQELAPQPNETVLDFCAAPGGKLGCMAQIMGNRGRLFAQDTGLDRMRLIAENCARLGITCVHIISAGGALEPNEAQTRQPTDPSGLSPAAPPAHFDRVLVDAPCSNTGVMRRRVDLRWRLRLEEIERMATSQLRLLEEAAGRLRPGGRLVYSTCSLEREENEGVVELFLASNPAFSHRGQRTLLPFIDGVDGAFVACLERVGSTGGLSPAGA